MQGIICSYLSGNIGMFKNEIHFVKWASLRASRSREIFQLGKEPEVSQLNFINLRYRFLPFIYSLATNVNYNNGTIVHGFLIYFPGDVKAVPISDQFMFGKSLMVAPVTKRLNEGENLSNVYLPKGTL